MEDTAFEPTPDVIFVESNGKITADCLTNSLQVMSTASNCYLA